MTQLLFEQPVKLFFLWLCLQVVATIYWRIKRNPSSVKALWICFVLLPVLETICLYVITPREQIQQRCHALAGYVKEGDTRAIADTIDETFEASAYKKDILVLRIDHAVKQYSVSDVNLQRIEVQFSQDQQSDDDSETAVAEFDATAVIRSREMQYEPVLSRWRLTFIRRQPGHQQSDWKIVHIKVLPRPFSPIRSLRQCLK